MNVKILANSEDSYQYIDYIKKKDMRQYWFCFSLIFMERIVCIHCMHACRYNKENACTSGFFYIVCNLVYVKLAFA